jgi:hypothetical protein
MFSPASWSESAVAKSTNCLSAVGHCTQKVSGAPEKNTGQVFDVPGDPE